ncbi:uncharacterized protein BKCO1_25000113 [Diplodia corticola]|uniref:Uncharacterized protein n=1 Tax=Diplodia corticola TaxID=236234 RepID=A0A1J9S0Q0_9PEZI|nr:uncharacterized protein BKCO1_25000113 [Diplodia corticola]OJD34159.1 hypothetical protein BKCO1_25000113 [Diplodia corticola]
MAQLTPASSFFDNTNPEPFDQIVVQSQKMVNNALWNMWALSDDDSPVRGVDVAVPGFGRISGSLSAPSVTLHVESTSPTLYFLVPFSSGTLQLGPDSSHSWKVDGWVFAFPVEVASNELAPGTDDYARYVKRMGISPGSFSLVELLIDISRANTWDKKHSSFSHDWETESPAVQQLLNQFVAGWLRMMAADDRTVIGVSIKAARPESVNHNAPTFVPTSCEYAVYPWLGSGALDKPSDGANENALCYLLMTDNATPPAIHKLPHSGNFVDATSNHQGTFCMDRAQFWERWLLPLLQEVNALTETYSTTPYVDANWDGSGCVGPRYYIGYNPEHTSSADEYFQFPDSSTYVRFAPGGQAINVSGQSDFQFKVYQTGAVSGPFKTEAHYTITTKWHLNFALGVVSDGGLQIARIEDPKGVPACTSTGHGYNEGIDAPWDDYIKSFSDTVNKHFTENLGFVLNRLQSALAEQHKLFLPASGTFLMRDALFNRRGDLIASLFYNGNQPPSYGGDLPDYFASLPDRLPLHEEVPRAVPQEPFGGPDFAIHRKAPVGAEPPA